MYGERFEMSGVEVLTRLLRVPSRRRRVPSTAARSGIAFAFEIVEMLLRDISDFKEFTCARKLHGIRSVSMGSVCGLGFDCKILMNATKSMWGTHAHTCR